MISVIISLFIAFVNPNKQVNFEEPKKMRITCYTSSPNAYTYSGQKVHLGGCAGRKEDLGKYVVLFNDDMELIGIYQINDIGGHHQLKNGTALDLYKKNIDDCWAYVRKNGDHAWVIYVDVD